MLEGRSKAPDEVASAIRTAGRWARQFLISESGLEAAVTQAASEPVELIRVRWRGRTRRIVVRSTLTQSRVRNVQEPLDPGPFDPWAESTDSLAARTRQISRCRTCDGEKKVRCPVCGGSATIACDMCNGSGSTWSPRSRRMIGCRACRKSGRRTCPCFDGKIPCESCNGKGKVEEWLEVAEELFDRVTFTGSEVLAQVLPGCADSARFDNDFQGASVPLLYS